MLTINKTQLQKHQVMGPVGYEVVGSPTLADGMVSGDATNYVRVMIPTTTTIQTLELNVRIKAYAGATYIYHGWNSFFQFYTEGFGLLSIQSVVQEFHRFGQLDGQTDFNLHAMYEAATNTWTATVTNLATQAEETVTWVSQDTPNYTGEWSLGGHSWNPNAIAGGSVDLNHTYIKVNGKLCFYHPADTKYIVKDGNLVWADPKLALSGPVTYTVVGSPMIEDGVVSNLTKDDYVKLAEKLAVEEGQDCEMVFKIHTPDEFQTDQCIFSAGYDGVGYDSGVYIYSNGSLSFRLYNFIRLNAPAGTILPDTTYYVKGERVNGVTRLSISEDNQNWTVLATGTSTIAYKPTLYDPVIGKNVVAYNDQVAFSGFIDLKESYIRIGDELWFYGKNYATKNIAPVPAGYTFGNTTTPSMGYVDMRTQTFTAAPSGATLGRVA